MSKKEIPEIFLRRRPTTEELESLQRVVDNDDFKIFMIYMRIIEQKQLDELGNSPFETSVIQYNHAKLQGGREIIQAMQDLKKIVIATLSE